MNRPRATPLLVHDPAPVDAGGEKAGWGRARPPTVLSAETVQRLVATGFPGRRVVSAELLPDGLSNTTYRLHLDGRDEPVVLRLYDRDPGACEKEVGVMERVRPTVPVPRVHHAEPDGTDGSPPFALLEFVEGITFRALKQGGDLQAIAQASYSAGRTLAAIGGYGFPRAGWIEPDLSVGAPLMEGSDAIARFIDQCIASPVLRARLPADDRERLHAFAWRWAPALRALEDERALVHCDFGGPNLLVHRVGERWTVAAVLDWEYAIAGAPLTDAGHFLRYERADRPLREPHFSRGFSDGGGVLPGGWRGLARAMDLTALCEMLTRSTLPGDVAAELAGLVRATVEERDPA